MSFLWCPKDRKYIEISECMKCPFHIGCSLHNCMEGTVVCGFIQSTIELGKRNR